MPSTVSEGGRGIFSGEFTSTLDGFLCLDELYYIMEDFAVRLYDSMDPSQIAAATGSSLKTLGQVGRKGKERKGKERKKKQPPIKLF